MTESETAEPDEGKTPAEAKEEEEGGAPVNETPDDAPPEMLGHASIGKASRWLRSVVHRSHR